MEVEMKHWGKFRFFIPYLATFFLVVAVVFYNHTHILYLYRAPFLFFPVAVVLVSLASGFRVGLFAAVLSVFLANIFLFPPIGVFSTSEFVLVPSALFVFSLLILVGLSHLARNVYFELKKTADSLGKKEWQLKKTQEIARIGSFEFDFSNNKLDWSDEVYPIFNIDPQKTKPSFEAFLGAIHPDDRQRVKSALINSISDDKEGCEMNYRVFSPGGKERDIYQKCKHFRGKRGEIVRSIGMVRDITKYKKTDQAKTEFVAAASHQLKTPLASLRLSLEMLLRKSKNGDSKEEAGERRKYLKSALEDMEAMSTLVDTLLNVSRLEMGTFAINTEPKKLNSEMRSIVSKIKPLAQEKKLSLEEKYNENVPEFMNIDPLVLSNVVRNLLSNSIKYTPEGGCIAVSTKKEGSLVIISVADNGEGIPENMKNKLFTKMLRAYDLFGDVGKKKKGSGMGLYIVKSMLDQSGGSILVESPGKGKTKGTTFRIFLPVEGMKAKRAVS